jgi:hypothetical protein
MYIPISIILLLMVIYFYDREKISEEISSLRDGLHDYKYHMYDSGDDYWDIDSPSVKDEQKIKATDYTFQESQDRQLLGVEYSTSLKEIKNIYHAKVNEYNLNPKPENDISEIHLAYKRLEKVEILREKEIK